MDTQAAVESIRTLQNRVAAEQVAAADRAKSFAHQQQVQQDQQLLRQIFDTSDFGSEEPETQFDAAEDGEDDEQSEGDSTQDKEMITLDEDDTDDDGASAGEDGQSELETSDLAVEDIDEVRLDEGDDYDVDRQSKQQFFDGDDDYVVGGESQQQVQSESTGAGW